MSKNEEEKTQVVHHEKKPEKRFSLSNLGHREGILQGLELGVPGLWVGCQLIRSRLGANQRHGQA